MQEDTLEAKVFGAARKQGKTHQQQLDMVAKVNGTDKHIKIDLGLANNSCKRCHGTGLMGTKLHPDGRRERLVCCCVAKAMVAAGLA